MLSRINAGWVVAYSDGEHRLIKDGSCIVEGSRIVELGRAAEISTPVDVVYDCPSDLLTPGLISTHLHSGLNVEEATFTDPGRPDAMARNYLSWQAGLKGKSRLPSGGTSWHLFGLAQALISGATTVVDIGPGSDPSSFLEAVDQLGIRVYSGLSYRNVVMYSNSDGTIDYDWDDRRGVHGLKSAIEFAEQYDGRSDGRMRAILCPGHADTCSGELLRETAATARRMGIPVTVHGAISPVEVQRTLAMYRRTPIEFLHDCNLYGPTVIVGHAVFRSGHSWLPFIHGHDLDILGQSGTSVSFSAYKYMQMGAVIESPSRYAAAGVNITLGTDGAPSDIVEEMRLTAMADRIAERNALVGRPADMFNAVTINAANALGRNDLGRLAVGTTADLCVYRLATLRLGVVRDPIKSLVDYGTGTDARLVMVDGNIVVRDGALTGVDHQALLREGTIQAEALWADMPNWYWGGRTIADTAPLSFGPW